MADALPAAAMVQEILAAIPAGCSWLTPVTGPGGEVVDFRIDATSETTGDVHRLGVSRRASRVSELYPSMVGGDLWHMYHRVMATGRPEQLDEFHYDQQSAGVVAHSRFVIDVHPVLGGLLVWWQRIDEHQRRLAGTELLGSLGWTEYDLATGETEWSPGMYRIFGREPGRGPVSRAEQAAMILPEDRGIAETAWQTLDSGSTSDIEIRYRIGGAVKQLRILSDVARDAAGKPVKIYAVVQDVTARAESRTAIDRLQNQLRNREMTALAEHRLAGQLQSMIQPVPLGVLHLDGLEAIVGYLPAEIAVRVGGDWYHAQTLPDGQVLLAVGDVAGHGLDAASGMAHLRFALVAWLSIGIHDPTVLLRHMNRLCVQLSLTGTAVIAVFDRAGCTLRWARAGHMPPLLARAGSSAELPRPAGLLLGADPEATHPAVTEHLQPDDLVLLYTDGLTERRSPGRIDLLAEVQATLAAASAAGGDPLPRLRGLTRTASPDDDTCVLAVHVLS